MTVSLGKLISGTRDSEGHHINRIPKGPAEKEAEPQTVRERRESDVPNSAQQVTSLRGLALLPCSKPGPVRGSSSQLHRPGPSTGLAITAGGFPGRLLPEPEAKSQASETVLVVACLSKWAIRCPLPVPKAGMERCKAWESPKLSHTNSSPGRKDSRGTCVLLYQLSPGSWGRAVPAHRLCRQTPWGAAWGHSCPMSPACVFIWLMWPLGLFFPIRQAWELVTCVTSCS